TKKIMPVKIRLARRGRKKRAMYDVVVADVRAPRDGRFIEKIGIYNPNTDPAQVDIDVERAFKWVMDGAQPTDTVRAMLSYRGVMMRKHLQLGVLKGAITQEDADKKLEEWLAQKDSQIQTKVDKLQKEREDEKKSKLEAEAKVNQARIDAQLAKKKEAEAALAAEVAEANADVAEKEMAAEAEEAVEETAEAVEGAAEAVEEAAEATVADEAPEAAAEEAAASEEETKE
ncbi:MAG: 30S ribosomal protein S16, partial [Bacteroidota bacterium]